MPNTENALTVDEQVRIYSEYADPKHHVYSDGNLADALDDVAAANMATRETMQIQLDNLQEEQEEYLDELKAKVDAGEMTQKEADADFKAKVRSKGFPHSKIKVGQVVNLLVVGEPGGGKTSIIKEWADSRHFGLVLKTAAEIRDTVINGLPSKVQDQVLDKDGNFKNVDIQKYLPSTFFKELDDDREEWNILFIDELNRMWSESEAALLTLVQDHSIPDANDTENRGRHYFDRCLFTVGACNPPSTSKEAGQIGMAMRTRFAVYVWNSSPKEMFNYLNGELDYDIDNLERGAKSPRATEKRKEFIKTQLNITGKKKQILETIEKAGTFQFSDPDEVNQVQHSKDFANQFHVINARTFTAALTQCNGNPGAIDYPDGKQSNFPRASFMYCFRANCTKDDDILNEMNTILLDLQDDMESAANGFQKTLLDKYSLWKRRNGF